MFKLRQRLQAYFGTDLLQVPDLHTPLPGPNMSNSLDVTDTNPSQSPSNPWHTGSRKQSRLPKRKQSGHTSPASGVTMSTLDSLPLSSGTSESSECSVVPSEYMAQHQLDPGQKSPRIFLPASFTPSVTTMMTSTSGRHSPQPSLHSFEQGNSPGIPGTQLPRPLLHCPADPSNLSTKASFCTSPCQRPTNSRSVMTFHYLPLGTPAAPFVRSEHSSSATPNRPRTRFSQHHAAPSTRNGLRTNSQGHFSKPASTLRHTLVTPSVVAQPTQLLQQGSLGTRSKEWVVGSQMQWTDIFPSQPRRLNSFPPTGGSMWPPRVRRAPLHSLPGTTTDRADPRNFRTPGLAFQRGCLAADTALRAFGPVLG